jgi:hypothetical protein
LLLNLCLSHSAFDPDGRVTGPFSYIIRDLARDGAPVVDSFDVPSPPGYAVLTGNYVAYQAGTDITVRSIATHAATYTESGASQLGDLQGDGTVVAFKRSAGCERLFWASLMSPSQHLLPGCPKYSSLDGGDVRIAANRVAYERVTKRGSELIVTDVNGRGTDRVVALARIKHPVFGFLERNGALRAFDFDGHRVTYTIEGCNPTLTRTYVDALHNRATPTERINCALRLRPQTISVARNGIVRISVTCRQGCTGTVRLEGRRGKAIYPASENPTFGVSPRQRITLPLLPWARKQLLQRHSLSVNAVIDPPTVAGSTEPEVHAKLKLVSR